MKFLGLLILARSPCFRSSVVLRCTHRITTPTPTPTRLLRRPEQPDARVSFSATIASNSDEGPENCVAAV